MEAKHRATLEAALASWAVKEFENDGLPGDAYWPNNFVVNMANAAVAVFDANEDAQRFVRDET